MRLTPCSSCGRHVRPDSGACPFCEAPLPLQRSAAPRPDLITRGTRLSRAAVIAGATALGGLGCGSSAAEEERVEHEPIDWTTGHERTVTTIDVSHGRGGTGQGDNGDSEEVITVTDDSELRRQQEERQREEAERQEQEMREQELLEEQRFRNRNCDQCPYGAPPPLRRAVV